MDIESLKAGFFSYLKELEKNKGTNEEDSLLNDYSDVSIFYHAKEFKDYISDEYNVSPDVISMSVSDILKLEVVNGKLIDPEKSAEEQEENGKENTNTDAEQAAETANPEQAPENIETTPQTEGANAPVEGQVQFDETAVTDILNSLMEDEKFSGAIDKDKNGDMSKEELSEFFNTISGLDGDKTNVSLEDILNAAESIANNEFSTTPEPQTYYDEVNDATTEKSDYVPNTPTAAQSANSGGQMAPSSGAATPELTNPESVEHKDYDKMTKEELQSELSNAQSDLSEKQTTVNDIISGNTPELQDLKENIDKAYEEYQEALKKVDEDKAKQVDDLKKSIDAKEEEINNKDVEIANQESTVSACETNYNNAVSTRESLETTKGALESSLSGADDEQKASIQAQISEISNQIDTAKQEEAEAKQALDEANTTLENLKKEREELQSGENGLDELNKQMSQLEEEISEQYPELQDYKDKYNNAKEEYQLTKNEALDTAKGAVTEQQNTIKDINSAINKKDNNNTIKDYIKSSMGEEVAEFAAQFIGCNEADGSADKFLASWTNSRQTPWCAAFVQYIYEHSDAADSLPEWYSSISNKWSCGNLYRAGQAAGAQINGADSQTGDMVIFDWDKSDNCVHDHVGIIVSVENGVVKTIEGNTSNQVAYRTYKIDDPRLSYFKMT